MGTPQDWERHAQSIGTFNAPVSAPALAPTQIGPANEFDVVMQRRRVRSQQEELEAELEDEQETRELKRAERRAKVLRANHQIAQLENPQQSSNGMSEMVLTIMREAAEDRKELLAELSRARTESSNNTNSEMMKTLQAMQSRIETLAVPNANGADPIAQLVTQLKAVTEVRHVLDEAIPAPPAINPGQSRAQQLEEIRIDREYRLREFETKAALEDAQAKRENIVAEREGKLHRVDRATEMVENVLAPIAAAIGSEGIGNKLGGLFGGGNKTENGNGAQPAAAPSTAGPPGPPEAMPWVCPDPDCGFTNSSPAGTTFDVCKQCKLGVTLQPAGAETGSQDGFQQV